MNAEYAARRTKVERLLRDGTSTKLLRGGSQYALSALKQAYDEAHNSKALCKPWSQLTAYRLAHLMFRDVRGETRVEWLKDIDEYFVEATQDITLGPLPRIYRLAVLHRLMSVSGKEEESSIRNTMNQVFDLVVDQVKRQSNGPEAETPAEGCGHAQLQNGIVNMLEFAAYFCEFEYGKLEGLVGLSSPYADLGFDDEGWRLFGPDPAMSSIRYPRLLAEAELEELGKEYPNAILFKFPRQSGTRTSGSASWKLPGKQWEIPSERHVRLLACLLPSQEVNRIHGDNEDHRQLVRRVRSVLAETTGQRGEDLILRPSRNADTYRIASSLTVFGVVEGRLGTP